MALPAAGRLQVGRMFRIPVHVHVSWLVVLGLMTWTLAGGYVPSVEPGHPLHWYWLTGLLASMVLFGSTLLHEMAHALVARRAGVEIRSVTLFLFGGVAEMGEEAPHGRTELRIALAGPAGSVALAALFGLAALGAPSLLRPVCRYAALVNAGIALFNLIPAYPLDGGRILRELLWDGMGKARATRAAAGAGTAFGLVLMASGAVALGTGATVAGLWYCALGWFLLEASGGAANQARVDELLRGVRVRDVMLTHVDTLPCHLSLTEAADGYFRHTGYSSYPTVRGDEVVGLLSLRDLLRVPGVRRGETSVQGAMRPLGPAISASADEPLLAALVRIAEDDAARLLVVEEGRLVGLLTMGSALRQIAVREKLAA